MGRRTDTRAKMIEAAYRLFRTRGYRGTSVADLAEVGQVPRGAVHFHFPGGKEELATEVARLATETFATSIRDLGREADSAKELIFALFGAYVALMEESDYSEGCGLAALVHDLVPGCAIVETACQVGLHRWEEALQQAFAASGIEESRTQGLATVVLAALEGALLMCRAQKSTTALLRSAEQLGELAYPATKSSRQRRRRNESR